MCLPMHCGVKPDHSPSVSVSITHSRVVIVVLRVQPTGQLYCAIAPASSDIKIGLLMSSVQSPPVGGGGSGHIPPRYRVRVYEDS